MAAAVPPPFSPLSALRAWWHWASPNLTSIRTHNTAVRCRPTLLRARAGNAIASGATLICVVCECYTIRMPVRVDGQRIGRSVSCPIGTMNQIQPTGWWHVGSTYGDGVDPISAYLGSKARLWQGRVEQLLCGADAVARGFPVMSHNRGTAPRGNGTRLQCWRQGHIAGLGIDA